MYQQGDFVINRAYGVGQVVEVDTHHEYATGSVLIVRFPGIHQDVVFAGNGKWQAFLENEDFDLEPANGVVKADPGIPKIEAAIYAFGAFCVGWLVAIRVPGILD